MNYALIQNLININDYTTAELLLKSNPCNDSIWHYCLLILKLISILS